MIAHRSSVVCKLQQWWHIHVRLKTARPRSAVPLVYEYTFNGIKVLKVSNVLSAIVVFIVDNTWKDMWPKSTRTNCAWNNHYLVTTVAGNSTRHGDSADTRPRSKNWKLEPGNTFVKIVVTGFSTTTISNAIHSRMNVSDVLSHRVPCWHTSSVGHITINTWLITTLIHFSVLTVTNSF